MELERDFIERRDFSTVRRGYEPVEVQEHLRSVADRVDDMRRELAQQEQPGTSLSGAAAEHVRVILDAAEQSAQAIRENAEEEARQAIEEAARRAEERRAQADAEARAQLDHVQQATQNLHQRAGRLESELDRLLNRLRDAAGEVIDTFRAEGGNLQADLDALRTELDEARAAGAAGAAAGPEPVDTGSADADLLGPEPGYAEPDPGLVEPAPVEAEPLIPADELAEPSAAEAPGQDVEVEEPPVGTEVPGSPVQRPTLNEPLAPAAEPAAGDLEPAPEPDTLEADLGEPAPEPAQARSSGSSEGARLIALNMALNGTPREETAEYLRREFNLEDEQMLDDVYARVRSS